ALPPLPFRTPHTDKELDDYARTVADLYTEARPAAEHDENGIGAKIRRYQDTQAKLDVDRVRRPAEAVFDPETAHRLASEAGAQRLGRQLRRAALAGLVPADVLAWHARQLDARGETVTAMNLTRDMAFALETATRDADLAWLAEHGEVLREHFAIAAALADRAEDPRWMEVVGRMRQLTTLGGYDLTSLCEHLTASTHPTSLAPGILAALDDLAPAGHAPVGQNAPHWVASPAADAHQVDPDLAALLHDQYTDIATEHTAVINRIAADAEHIPTGEPAVLEGDFAFTEHFGPRPTEAELTAHWDRTVAEIHSYRDAYGITDTISVAGDRPDDRNERASFNTVHDGIDTYHDHVTAFHEQQQREHRQRAAVDQERSIATSVHIENERRGPRL
ncbi:MAG TPA: hypothetical protein VJ777_14145, partial [Mycobacterium sp.]|nr:hypothetical protein [Mycobacterium sp.]